MRTGDRCHELWERGLQLKSTPNRSRWWRKPEPGLDLDELREGCHREDDRGRDDRKMTVMTPSQTGCHHGLSVGPPHDDVQNVYDVETDVSGDNSRLVGLRRSEENRAGDCPRPHR